MKKILFSFVIAAVFLGSGSVAMAYELPSSVSTKGSVSLGSGEVDLSKGSVLSGTITVDNVSGEIVWITAGDVAHGSTGYGFVIAENLIYVVSNTGSMTFRMPLAFVRTGQTVTVSAVYTPGDGIRTSTSATGQYSIGIVQGFLPDRHIRGLGAFNAFVEKGDVNLVVGSWAYRQ